MPPQSKPVRVLVVDDDAMSREVLGVLLEGEGYAVESADSGDAALALLAGGKFAPEIVLSDMQMPGITGRRLADRLRRACGPGTLLLAMSGSGPAEEAISHFDGFLMKPLALENIAAALAASRGGTGATATLDLKASGEAGDADETGSAPGIDTIGGPVLNERIYRQLSVSMPAQPLLQMYAMCVNDARARIAAMRRLAVEGNGAQFVREAHAVKGSSGMLGATELYRIAAQLETAGLGAPGLGGMEDVNPLDELAGACDRLERILASRA